MRACVEKVDVLGWKKSLVNTPKMKLMLILMTVYVEMLIKVLVLKLVEAMMLDSGVGGEIESGDGEVVELEVVTEVSL